MGKIIRKPWFVFVALVILVSAPLFLLPLNVFQGEIVYHKGISTIVEQRPLSLHFVSGLEYNREELEGVKDYYLTSKGWMLAFIFTIGLPGLIAYRVYLKNTAKSKE